MPFFSIIIPTTRVQLLPEALASALGQSFPNFEIVVSDNSNEGCESVVTSFASDKVRRVCPTDYMTATAHWDFALSHARGDWVVMLCDDDALVPGALQRLYQAINAYPDIDSVTWLPASYRERDEGPILSVPSYSGAHSLSRSNALIELMFASGGLLGNAKRAVPFFPLAAFSKKLLDRIRDVNEGNLFQAPCPMTSGALFALALSGASAKIDAPLTVLGSPPDSAGSMIKNQETYKRMHRGVVLNYAPIKTMALFPSTMIESLLKAKEVLGELLPPMELNYEAYFIACHGAIGELRTGGWDVISEQELFDAALQTFPPALGASVRRQIKETQATVDTKMGSVKPSRIITGTVGNLVRRLFSRSHLRDQLWTSNNADLSSVTAAARSLGSKLPPTAN